MKVLKNKKTRVFIIIMSALVFCAIIIGKLYYKYQNESIDPRIVKANLLYESYNDLTKKGDYQAIFYLLDSIETIYAKIPHYKKSYEVGVLYNNRAAAYISMAIAPDGNDSIVKDSLLSLAEYNINKSIEIYTNWLDQWGEKSEMEIKEKLIPCFNPNKEPFTGRNIDRFINKRAKEIIEAQVETPRRLSASLTNMGVIYRHRGEYEKAVQEYIAALKLWPDNLAAENSLNVLFDKPMKKRSLFRRFFPKDRIN